MPRFTIEDITLAPLRDKVIIVTGGVSGIGLATVRLLSGLGAKVVAGDRNPPPIDLSSPDVTYFPVDVTVWKEQVALFKKTLELHGRIDHVFANAGIYSSDDYLDDQVDQDGDLLPPTNKTIEVNLVGVIYTVRLALHYLRKQEGGGSIVMTASAAAFLRIPLADYAVAKHGVLGLMRALVPILQPRIPIRINTLAPSWTETGMLGRSVEAAGVPVQGPEHVARAAAVLMADTARHGQLIYTEAGQHTEFEEAMRKNTAEILEFDFTGQLPVEELMGKLMALAARHQVKRK